MKAKIMVISMLTAAAIFVFCGATWADGKKDRHPKNPKLKHYNVSVQQKPVHHQPHWTKANPYHAKTHHYRHRAAHRAKGNPHRIYNRRPFRHRLHDRHHYPYKRYYKHRPASHRPAQKYQPARHHRPIYSHTDGNVSILASTSHHGWSIKISSKD